MCVCVCVCVCVHVENQDLYHQLYPLLGEICWQSSDQRKFFGNYLLAMMIHSNKLSLAQNGAK